MSALFHALSGRINVHFLQNWYETTETSVLPRPTKLLGSGSGVSPDNTQLRQDLETTPTGVDFIPTRTRITLFLKNTYEQPRPPAGDIMEAKATYDECSWTSPSDDDLCRLALPPSSQEVARKLKRAFNTSSGSNEVENKDILRVDPSGRLLEVLYAAVTLRHPSLLEHRAHYSGLQEELL
jgi:hypothetical protein